MLRAIAAFVAITATFNASLNASLACTAVDVVATDGTVVAGRTMEWAFDMQWSLISLPKGSSLTVTFSASTGSLPLRVQLAADSTGAVFWCFTVTAPASGSVTPTAAT